MFSLFKKNVRAPEHQRQELVRRLFLHLYSIAEPIHDIPSIEDLMMNSQVATILRFVENFYTLRDRGLSENDSISFIKEHNEALLTMTLSSVGPLLHDHNTLTQLERYLKLPDSPTLLEVIYHTLDSLCAINGSGEVMEPQTLAYTIEEIAKFYRR